jgi:hypothetical protein
MPDAAAMAAALRHASGQTHGAARRVVMSVKEPVPAAKKQPLAVAKPLTRQCLYAVFDTEAVMQQAEQALAALGVQPQRFSNSRHRSILAHIERAMMHLGDDLMGLQRYAVQAENGHAVLAVAVADRSAARQIYQTLVQHDAYDVTYFRTWTAEYVGPRQKVEQEALT